jgi:lysophospholipase L1-like esterase
MRLKVLFWVLTIAIAVSPLRTCAGEGTCFIKDGDRVAFFGDSITAHKVYGELLERVFRHSHPEANVDFINNGQSGLQLSGTKLQRLLKGDPNVITIMIGMNDAINSRWVKGDPIEPKVKKYQTELTALVRGLKEKQKIVVLLSPTLTDETVAASYFRLEGTEALLRRMGQVCEQVAKKEAVYFVPVQSEFETYELSLPRYASLRPDGVHPCARGHYQIARSLWTHLNLGAPLAGKRIVDPTPKALAIEMVPSTNILTNDSQPLALNVQTESPGPVTVTWSSGQEKGSFPLTLKGTNVLTLSLPKTTLPQTAGTSAEVVVEVEVERQGTRKFFILDLFRKAVIHGKDGKAEANLTDEKGTVLASYCFAKEGKGLRIEVSAFKENLTHIEGSVWPWGRGDCVNLLLDLREQSRLGGLGYDGDVYQLWFNPQEKPFFTPGFIPWAGKHMVKMATTYGERNAKGYTVGLLLSGNINIQEPVNFSTRSLIGFDLSLNYVQATGKKKWLAVQKSDRHSFLFPGAFSLVDLYGTIKEDSVLNLSIFPGNP